MRLSILVLTALTSIVYATAGGETEDVAIPKPRPECPPCCKLGGKTSCDLAICNECRHALPPPGSMTIMQRAIPTPPPDTPEEANSSPFEECPECCKRAAKCRLAVCNEPICKEKSVLEAREPEAERHLAPIVDDDSCPSCCAKNGRLGCALAACANCNKKPSPPIEARDEEILPICPPCCSTKTKPLGCMLAICNKCVPRPEPHIPNKTPVDSSHDA